MEGQALEDEEIELLGTLKGKVFDTVTILDNVNAKAVKVAWEDIEEIISSEDLDDNFAGYLSGKNIKKLKGWRLNPEPPCPAVR